MSTLTHQDKADLNRRARAHGLPDLWPEVTVARRIMDRPPILTPGQCLAKLAELRRRERRFWEKLAELRP